MERRKYQITLINWLTRSKRNFELGDTLDEAKKQLKVVRKKHGRFMWLRITPIHC